MSRPAANTLRVLKTDAWTPAANMAFDAALLQSDAAPTLRLYEWQPPGLSIGWFQDAAQFADVPGRHRIVRRPTGGGAIYHDDEITFAIVGGNEAFGSDTEALYARAHDAIVRALGSVGVDCRRIADGPAGPGARSLCSAWCFAHPARHDVVTPDGRKLVGSAQRRVPSSGRVLQHGSLVLRAPEQTPFCAAVADQVDPESVREALEAALIDELARCFGLQARLAEAEAAELELGQRLESDFADASVRPCRSSKSC